MYFNQVEFGKRLRELRLSKGMTQEELAEALNINLDHMRKMERGRERCSIDLLLEIAIYFNVSTDYLLMGRITDREAEKKRLLGVISELSELVEIL